MKPALSGRADLIRALAFHDPHLIDQMAALLGYEEARTLPLPFVPPEHQSQTGPPTPDQEHITYEPADVPFWHPEAYEAAVIDERPPEGEPLPKSARVLPTSARDSRFSMAYSHP